MHMRRARRLQLSPILRFRIVNYDAYMVHFGKLLGISLIGHGYLAITRCVIEIFSSGSAEFLNRAM